MFCEGFFMKIPIDQVSYFSQQLTHIIWWWVKVSYFYDFFELVMLNPSPQNPLKTPHNPIWNPASFRAARSLLVNGLDQALGPRHWSAWCSVIGCIRQRWITPLFSGLLDYCAFNGVDQHAVPRQRSTGYALICCSGFSRIQCHTVVVALVFWVCFLHCVG